MPGMSDKVCSECGEEYQCTCPEGVSCMCRKCFNKKEQRKEYVSILMLGCNKCGGRFTKDHLKKIKYGNYITLHVCPECNGTDIFSVSTPIPVFPKHSYSKKVTKRI